MSIPIVLTTFNLVDKNVRFSWMKSESKIDWRGKDEKSKSFFIYKLAHNSHNHTFCIACMYPAILQD